MYLVEQCPVEPFRVTVTDTLTNSSFRTAATFWESLASPAALAAVLGVIDHECVPAVSVPDTCAWGRVDTLMVTTLYECGRLSSTTALHESPPDAPAGEIVRAPSATAETATALRTLPTFVTTICATLTMLTVSTTSGVQYAPKSYEVYSLFTHVNCANSQWQHDERAASAAGASSYSARACVGIDCANENRLSGSYLLLTVANLERFDP